MKKKVLLVVDYQNDFVNGALGFDSAKNIDAGIAKLIREYMNNGDVVIFTYDTHYKNYLDTQEGRKLPVPHCIYDTEGWELYGETYKASKETYKTGKMLSCIKETFGSVQLIDAINKAIPDIESVDDIESITVVGVVTNMCVISNAVIAKAACPNAEIIIKKDLVDSFDKEMHEKALSVMESMQMTIA